MKRLVQPNNSAVSHIKLEPFTCDICGKHRSQGNRLNKHVRCSKIRQQRFADAKP